MGDEICRKQAPQGADGYSTTWELGEFAYVCDYGITTEEPKRVGLIDAFHGEGRQHGSNR